MSAWLDTYLGTYFVMILAMIAANVVLGVSIALRREEFDWLKFLKFFKTEVFSLLLAWLGTAILGEFVVAEYLPEEVAILGPGISLLGFLAVVIVLGRDIIAKLRELWKDIIDI